MSEPPMTVLEFLDKQLGRLPGWPDGRGLVGASTVGLTVMVLWMYVSFPEIRGDDFFKGIATLICGTGFINSVVPFFYGQNRASEDAARRGDS